MSFKLCDLQKNVLPVEDERVTFEGGEKEGNQSAGLLSKPPFVTGGYIFLFFVLETY